MACLACKQRKVRCSGDPTCKECLQVNLACVYRAPDSSSRSRKKIKRGHVIEACKRGLSETSSVTLPTSPSLLDARQDRFGDVLENIDFAYYSTYIYPFVPIVSESEFRSAAANVNSSSDDAALAYALAAVTLNAQPNTAGDRVEQMRQVEALYKKALELRGAVMPQHHATVMSAMVPLAAAMLCCEKHPEMAFYYLREAITIAVILRVDDEESNTAFNLEEQAKRQRLYWVLFIHERYFSIVQYRPTVLKALPDLPLWHSSVPAHVQNGFCQIIHLFRSIDAEFVRIWLDKQKKTITVDWVKNKHAELVDTLAVVEKLSNELTDTQKVDLIVTRYWLCVLLWEKALSRFLLTADVGVDQSVLSIVFPTSLSRSLRQSLASVSRQAVDVHGAAIMQKIFEISVALADIILLVSADGQKSLSETLDDFNFLHDYLSSNPKFDHVAKSVLQSKAQSLRSTYTTW